jgi:acyl carrier protein
MLAGLSGIPEEEIDPARPLLEMGFDSLPLVQLSANIERSFEVKVTFGQILEDMPTLQQLAAHLEAVLGVPPTAKVAAGLDAPRAEADLRGGLGRIEAGTATSTRSGALGARNAAELLRALPDLSDAEVAAMLEQVLDDSSKEEGQE